MVTTITAPSVDSSTALLNKYKALPGNSAKTSDDFYTFLTAPSAERTLFLSENTVSEFTEANSLIIHKVIEKA
jgi:hypothetical protein